MTSRSSSTLPIAVHEGTPFRRGQLEEGEPYKSFFCRAPIKIIDAHGHDVTTNSPPSADPPDSSAYKALDSLHLYPSLSTITLPQ
ncbi:hypothetical protein G7K_5285-t1 [Saitoella complicata NRRL Y-17804]|uniref:Uncharacterized protein n=1 Tax=Saitoella complicata (strain BCRC 22490 / CBS 7301 / JCM 7358 / NBRC 10748 / NRRL Y-17804) TaxID=698492 RepID=A0A0E9NMV8_SAICN|nr:hypothetical protein G7K_5285-t1 [Saitoella complicata NRRL Y-17804]